MKTAEIQPVNPILASNMILLGIAVLVLSFYIIQANTIAADKYNIKVLGDRLTSLNEVLTSLSVQRSQTEDPSGLTKFAVSHNMVEAKNITYIFENGDVAQR